MAKKLKENIRKKPKRVDRRITSRPSGRPTLEESELTDEMKSFALYRAHGLPNSVIQSKIPGLTRYKVNRYLELDKVQKQVEKYKKNIAFEDAHNTKQQYQAATETIFQSIIRMAEKDELSESFMEKWIKTHLAIIGLDNDDKNNERSNKIGQKRIVRTGLVREPIPTQQQLMEKAPEKPIEIDPISRTKPLWKEEHYEELTEENYEENYNDSEEESEE